MGRASSAGPYGTCFQAATSSFGFCTTLVHAGGAVAKPQNYADKAWCDTSRFFFYIYDARNIDTLEAYASQQGLPPPKMPLTQQFSLLGL